MHTYASTKVSANVKRKYGFKYADDDSSNPELRIANNFLQKTNNQDATISLVGGNQIKDEEVQFVGRELRLVKEAMIYDNRGNMIRKVLNPFINKNSISLQSSNPGLYLIILDGKTYKVMLVK